MNILPKKKWHVRTKDNIARVRRDEAQAREEERIRQEKLEYAESEVRINFLRKQSGIPERQSTVDAPADKPNLSNAPDTANNEHVNLFADYKTHVKTTNKELEKEKKEEQEKYEKQIGYLTYLGQDTNEALKLRSWYEVAPKRAKLDERDVTEKELKLKHAHDPLTLINALLPQEEKLPTTQLKRKLSSVTEAVNTKPNTISSKEPKVVQKSHKHKKHKKAKKHKHKKKSSHKNQNDGEQQRKRDMLEKLRKERLRREEKERVRQQDLLAPKDTAKTVVASNQPITPRIVQKYNSQFNPELAKQNML